MQMLIPLIFKTAALVVAVMPTLWNLPKGQTYSSYMGIVFGHDTLLPTRCCRTSTDGGSNWTTRLNDLAQRSFTRVHMILAPYKRYPLRLPRSRLKHGPNTDHCGYNYNSAGMENYFRRSAEVRCMAIQQSTGLFPQPPIVTLLTHQKYALRLFGGTGERRLCAGQADRLVRNQTARTLGWAG